LVVAHPGLVLDLRLSEQHADVVDQKIDIGVRAGPVRDARFVARTVGRMHLHVVGAPALIDRVGVPRDIDALAALPLTALIDTHSGRPWPWTFSKRRLVTVTAPAFATDDIDAECAAVVAGVGFGQLIGPLAEPWLQSGALVPVLTAEAPEPWPIQVYRPQRAPVPARVRLVYDALVRALQ
ncbi:MAG: substrate binding domain-containing protein, partial [Burkholderiaceae bacterium]